LKISDVDWSKFDQDLLAFKPAGERYAPAMQALVNR